MYSRDFLLFSCFSASLAVGSEPQLCVLQPVKRADAPRPAPSRPTVLARAFVCDGARAPLAISPYQYFVLLVMQTRRFFSVLF